MLRRAGETADLRSALAFPVSLLVALSGAFPACGRAQGAGSVRGTVTDQSGQPLSGVVVVAQGLGISVATDASGRYVLARVPPGQRQLQFQRIGYARYQVTVDVVAALVSTADAVLTPEPIELGAVLVEGVSRAPDRMISAPAAVHVVRPASVEPVPLELARIPGVDVARGGVTDFNLNSRGFNTMLARKVLVLQDGRDVGTAVGGQQLWAAFSEPSEDLGRVEVIRGPGSALYGANAYNGVISIITPAARDIVGTKLTLGGGELGDARADLRHAGVWLHSRVGYRVNLGYARSDDWARSRTSRDSADWKREYASATSTPPPSTKPDSLPLFGETKDAVTGRAVGTPDPLVRVYGSVRIDYYAANRSIVTLEGGTARAENVVLLSGTGRNESPRVLRPWARLAWQGDQSDVSAWYSGASFSLVSLTSGSRLYNDESVFHLEGRTSRTAPADGRRLVVGASLQSNKVDSKGTALDPAHDDRSDQSYGAFAQLEYVIGEVRLIGAMRWDGSDLFPAQLSPKGALIWTLAKKHALRLSVGRAFLTPGLANLFGGRPAGPGVWNLTAIENSLRADATVGPALANVPQGQLFTNSAAVPESAFGNPHLVPQTATSYEVGYRGQFGRYIFITLDAYSAHIRNFTTGLLPAGATRLNPVYLPWTAPSEVAPASRAAVEAAALSALTSLSSTVSNGLTRLPDGTTAVVLSYGNVGAVDEWGVEAGASAALTRALTASVGYTWYNFAIKRNLAGNVLAANTPHNTATVSLTFAGGRRIDFGMDAHVVSRYRWTTGVWDGEIPARQTVSLNAGYRFGPHLRAYAHAADLFDQRRFQVYGGAVIGRRVLVGLTATF